MERPESESSWLREFARSFLPAILIVACFNLFIAQPRTVDGSSMEPTLDDNDRLIVELMSYRFGDPERGDIVMLRITEGQSSRALVKRIVGLPGDTIEIHDGNVYINGEKYDEPYVSASTNGIMTATLIPDGQYFVMGDNRPISNDSRYFGTVPHQDIIGKVWIRYWPFNLFGRP